MAKRESDRDVAAGPGEFGGELAAWAALAELLAGLLLREVDADMHRRLSDPAIAPAAREAGLDPTALPAVERLDELAGEYFETFVAPREGGPLVQSLWDEGRYEGEACVGVRELASAAGLELDAARARGASADHLGSLLLLWAATAADRPDVSARLAEAHLGWARAPLARLAAGAGFYAGVARATARWIDAVERFELERAAALRA